MTVKQNLIAIQMGSDERLPRSAMGYIDDLWTGTPAIVADRLAMLSRYVPDLCAEFKSEESK